MKNHVHLVFTEREVLKVLGAGDRSRKVVQDHLFRWVGTIKADQAIDRMILLRFVSDGSVLSINPSGARLLERAAGLPAMKPYVPPPVVRREGSMDFRECPSVMGNQRVVMC